MTTALLFAAGLVALVAGAELLVLPDGNRFRPFGSKIIPDHLSLVPHHNGGSAYGSRAAELFEDSEHVKENRLVKGRKQNLREVALHPGSLPRRKNQSPCDSFRA